MKNCEYCHRKPAKNEYGWVENCDNETCLASGGWSSLYIGVNHSGRIVMRACGDDYTDDYYPKYCPECGRKLNAEDNKDE